jgi:hypothetical protein
MLKGGSLQKITSYKFTIKNSSKKRISCTLTYKIYNLKNDKLQQQSNQVFVQCVQDIEDSSINHIIIYTRSSTHYFINKITKKS